MGLAVHLVAHSLQDCRVNTSLVVAAESGTARYARRHSHQLVEAGSKHRPDR